MQSNDYSDFETPLKNTKENHNYAVRRMIKLRMKDLPTTQSLEKEGLEELKRTIRAKVPTELDKSSLSMFTKSYSSFILYKQIDSTYVEIKKEASGDKRRTYLHQVFSIMHPWVRGLPAGETNANQTGVSSDDATVAKSDLESESNADEIMQALGLESESEDDSKKWKYDFSDANEAGIFGYLSRKNIPKCCREVVKSDENFVHVPTEITLDTNSSKQYLFFDTKLSKEEHFLELYCTYARLLDSNEQNHGIEERDVKTENVLFLNRDYEICSHVKMEETNIHCWFTPDPVVNFSPSTVGHLVGDEMDVDPPQSPLKTYGFPKTSVLSTVPVKTAINAIDDYNSFISCARLSERAVAATAWFSSTAIRRRIEKPLDKTAFSVFETTTVAAAAIEKRVQNETGVGTRHMALAATIMQSTSLDIFKNHFDVPPFVFVDKLGLKLLTQLKKGASGVSAQNCIEAVERCNEKLRSLFEEENYDLNCIKAVKQCTGDPAQAHLYKRQNDTNVISLCLESYSKNAYLHAVKAMSAYCFLSEEHDLKSPLKTQSCFLCIPERGTENSNALISTWVHRDRKATEEASKVKKDPAKIIPVSLESAYKTSIREKTKFALNKLIKTKYSRWIQEIKGEDNWVKIMDDVFKTNYSNKRHHPWTIHGVYLLCLCSGFMLKAACLAASVEAGSNDSAERLHLFAKSLHGEAARVAEQTLQPLYPNDSTEKAIKDPIDLVFFYNNDSNPFPSIDESYSQFPVCPTKDDSKETRDVCLEFSRKLCTFAYVNEKDIAPGCKLRFFLGALSTKDHSKEDTFHAPYFEKTLRENLFKAYTVVAPANFSEPTKIASTFLGALSSLALEKEIVFVIEDTPHDPACAKVAALLTWIEFSKEGSVGDLLRYRNSKFNSRDVREKRSVPKFMMGAVNAMHLVPPADRTDAIYEFTVGVDADDAGHSRESVLYTTEQVDSEGGLGCFTEDGAKKNLLEHIHTKLEIATDIASDEGNDRLVTVLVASALMKADAYLMARKRSLDTSWGILQSKRCQYTPMSLVIQKLISKVDNAIDFLCAVKKRFFMSNGSEKTNDVGAYYTTIAREKFDTGIFSFGWLDYLKCEDITNEVEALNAQFNFNKFLYSSPRSSLNTAEIVLDSISEWGKCILPVQKEKTILTIPAILQKSKASFLNNIQVVTLRPRHLAELNPKPPFEDYTNILTNYFPLFLIFAYATENDPSLELLGYNGFFSYMLSKINQNGTTVSTPLAQMKKLVLVLPPGLKPLIPFW